MLLLHETESQLGIISMLTKCISDSRRSSSITHSVNELNTLRVFQIACGYEDCNDSNSLRIDPAMKIALGRLPETGLDLASQPTFSRLENMITRRDLYRIADGIVDHFLASYVEPPEVIVLDFDDTEDVVHGHQQLALFSGYYQETCYQPLHVYEGFSGKLITTILRPGKRPGSREIVSYVKRIVERIRQKWPDTILVYRGDSHYSAPEVFAFIDQQNDCYSVTGLTRNALLLKHVETLIKHVKQQPAGFKRYHSFMYKAESWSKPRKVVAKVEMTDIGKLNVRFISTDMPEAKAKALYEEIYCARGNDELCIKDHKTYTKSDRTSCHRFLANQFRLFLHSAAYVLLHSFRSNMLKGTSMATATFESIRLKILKIGARVIERKTKISVQLPTAYPYQSIFSKCLAIFEHLRRQPWPPPTIS
ncbi:transposase IS4 family protein [Pelodictyon phaeoclathratiforme BU-1]|uniref:Transposase IS4 family protein n=1 Tax=Pelodictyon phaeoclathratiforme (strain DSM 5477 / BU-1) TaxID=324925 RepID=B4SDG9_PELPB|nr:transposase IS4 family protein [Pelodictyon phaeoclathratiforme BU-1]